MLWYKRDSGPVRSQPAEKEAETPVMRCRGIAAQAASRITIDAAARRRAWMVCRQDDPVDCASNDAAPCQAGLVCDSLMKNC